MGSTLHDAGLRMTKEERTTVETLNLGLLGDSSVIESHERWAIAHSLLNPVQRIFYETVEWALAHAEDQSNLYYLDGPGGTGKTFLLNCIIDYIESQNMSVVPVASTGVAALLLPKGQTAHSAFKIPVKFSNETYCSFSSKDKIGVRLFNAKMIIWDKAVAMH
jgi:hypothetical protein